MDTTRIKMLPLLIIVAMLAFSVRLVDFSLGVSDLQGSAFAESAPKEAQDETKHSIPHKMDSLDESTAKEEMVVAEASTAGGQDDNGIKWRDAKDEGIGDAQVRKDVMGEIAERRRDLDEKEKDLKTREAILRASQQELEQKYKELVNLRAQIENLLNKQSKEEEARITSLVKIYEGMKPKDAARIFDTLDLDVLIAVLGKMSERKLSPILASMNPERARTITIMLAEEKQLPKMP